MNTTKTSTTTNEIDGTARYRGFTLVAKAEDGSYWVSGEERWMTLAQIDALIAERNEAAAE